MHGGAHVFFYFYCISEAGQIAVTLGILMTYKLQLTVTAELVWQWFKKMIEPKVLLKTGSKKQEATRSGADIKGRKVSKSQTKYRQT